MNVHYEVKGQNDTRPTVVLIHGVAGSLHIWDPIFEDLAARFRVVRVDLLGYGHSPKPRLTYTPQVHVDAIRHALRDAGIVPPYHLVGLSMGVTLVLSYAELFPDEVATVTAIGHPYYRTMDQARIGLRHNTWTGLTIAHPVLARLIVPPIWGLGRIGVLPTRLFTRIYSPVMAHDTLLNPYRVFRSNVWNCMVNVDASALLEASGTMQRLFIHGGHDQWAPSHEVQQAVSRFANTSFVLIPGAEHNVVVLEPDRTRSAILDFLDS